MRNRNAELKLLIGANQLVSCKAINYCLWGDPFYKEEMNVSLLKKVHLHCYDQHHCITINFRQINFHPYRAVK